MLSKGQSRVSGEEEAPMKQGIVAILDSDIGDRAKAASIRRTLSADMSSRKWLEQNGMKKTASSAELIKLPISDSSSSSSSEGEEEFEKFPRQDDVWRSIQEEKHKPAPLEDVWSSIIMSQKTNDSAALPPPYIHPMVKRSSSVLSDKSLEICTESLGSETGSDCFSAYCSSDEGQNREIKVLDEELKKANQFGDFSCGAAKYKESPARPPPPPIHSISGGPIHMNSHRENGRLVVEAVSVPPRNFFQAHRRDGRLVLSMICTPPAAEMEDESVGVAESENNSDEIDEEILEEKDAADTGGSDGGYVEEEEKAEEEFHSLHKSGATMPKFMPIGNRNRKPDAAAATVAAADDEFSIAQSLPPQPPRVSRLIRSPPTAAASFNAHEYFWRTTAGAGGYINPMSKRRYNGVKVEQNKAEYFGPYFRGCKEGRKSMLIWEPRCIAT